jgi:hypothetical protein
MAEVQKEAVKAKANGGAAIAALGDGFDEIITDRAMYKPEQCKERPLIGHLLGVLDMPETDNGPWSAFVIRVTQPTLVVEGDDVRESRPNEEVLITSTAKLKQAIGGMATVADKVYQVHIQPTHQVKLDGGRKMWMYKVGKSRQTKPKTGEFDLPIASRAAPALSGTPLD